MARAVISRLSRVTCPLNKERLVMLCNRMCYVIRFISYRLVGFLLGLAFVYGRYEAYRRSSWSLDTF